MSTVSSPFDPSKTLTGSSFPSLLGSGYGKLVFFNLSPYELRLHFSNGDERLAPAWWARRFDILQDPCDTIAWTVEATPSSSNPPLSQCWIEVYGEDEDIPEQYPAALVRQANIGNQVGVTSSQSVQNDGNPAGTVVVEGTPSGAATSQLKLTNDGQAVLGGGNIDINAAGVFTAIPADAIPPAALGAGALDTDVTVLPKQITLDGTQADETFAGAGDLFLNHGIHIAGSIFGTGGVVTVGDALKPAGGWDPSAAFPGSQVSGDVAANQVGPGALDADVTIAGTSVTGTVGLAGNLYDGTHELTLTAGGRDLLLATLYRPAGTGIGVGMRTWDGTASHDREVVDPTGLLNADTVPATGVAAGALAAGVTIAGSSVTSPPWATMTSAGGGAAGTKVWEGTTDPGASAAEGDLWVDK